MKITKLLFAILLAVALIGCGKQAQPRHIVILVDVSGSIDRQALHQAFGAIDELVGRLHRGDRIAIIPIFGDAEVEASGRITRFQVPINRQTYDSDLKAFRRKLKTSLATMEAVAVAHPGARTDILGSIVLAEQEFQAGKSESKRLLVIVSDFIQEDHEINFTKDGHLTTPSTAREFAMQAARSKIFNFKGLQVYLGLLRSHEYMDIGRRRREAIQEFWIRYFKCLDAVPTFVTDGSGLLKSSIYID